MKNYKLISKNYFENALVTESFLGGFTFLGFFPAIIEIIHIIFVLLKSLVITLKTKCL